MQQKYSIPKRQKLTQPEQRQEFKEKWRREDKGPAFDRGGMSPRPERPGRMMQR